MYSYIYVRIWFPPSSTHKAFGPKRTWGMRFIIVCVLDPNRYLSDMNISARLHMWRMGGEKFTIHAPKSCFGEASLPVKIPVTDGSFESSFMDLTKNNDFCIRCIPKFSGWSRFAQKIYDSCIHCPVWDLAVFLWISCPGGPGVKAEIRSAHIYMYQYRYDTYIYREI